MSRPAEGTPEWDLWIAAIEVAMDAPWKPGATVTSAQIWWPKVLELRRALDACGVDWAAAKEKETPRPMRRARRDESGSTGR